MSLMHEILLVPRQSRQCISRINRYVVVSVGSNPNVTNEHQLQYQVLVVSMYVSCSAKLNNHTKRSIHKIIATQCTDEGSRYLFRLPTSTLIGNNKDQKYVTHTAALQARQAGGFDDPILLFPVFVSYLIIMFSLQDLDDDQLVVNQSRPQKNTHLLQNPNFLYLTNFYTTYILNHTEHTFKYIPK